eukprot:1833178-Alexandrium_andersonii.AAC.1
MDSVDGVGGSDQGETVPVQMQPGPDQEKGLRESGQEMRSAEGVASQKIPDCAGMMGQKAAAVEEEDMADFSGCLLYTSPSPRD